MNQAIADGVGDAWLANGCVPRGRWQLTRKQRGRSFAPIFDNLQQVAAFGIRERRQEPIVDRQEIEVLASFARRRA
jgi:hypothetical protein